MCFVFLIAFLGPRFGILIYWLGWPARWELAFDSFIVPFIGFLILPWTTLAWLLVAPSGVRSFDYVILALAFIADAGSLGGGGDRYRRRQMTAAY
jgi:hypothetical protein